MSDTPIKFGTDGWRAVIADDYTFENLERVAHATALWLKEDYGDTPKVALGHDTRFLGRDFAEYAARVLANQGVHVTLDNLYPLEHWPEVFEGRDLIVRLDPGRGHGHHKYVRTAGPRISAAASTRRRAGHRRLYF